MSDSKKKPKVPPPDDFSKTTPNINLPEDAGSDWDKTNHDIPSQTPADDWGKTVINYDVSELGNNDHNDDSKDEDFNSKHYENGSPKEPDWGMTQANVNLNSDFEANADNDFGGGSDDDNAGYGATVPYFKLPEAEREKYQNIPLTPTQKAQDDDDEKRKKGGVPMWFWITAGLMTMFAFAILVLVGAWFIIPGNKGFDVIVKDAPQGSKFFINGTAWGVPSTSNEHKLYNIESGAKTVLVVHPKFECKIKEIDGADGETINFKPECTPSESASVVKPDCEKTLDEDTRESCAEEILDGLSDPPELDRLLRALNLLRINFSTGSANVPKRNERILRKAAGHIKKLPNNVKIEVGGHTDDVGTNENNQKLSERRAKAVRDLLISFGISESRLADKGYGEEKPSADNKNNDGRARNRRIAYKAIRE